MRQVIFDVTRLFIRGSRFSPTGIDRVVMAYARWLLQRPDVSLQPVVTVAGRTLAAPVALLADIVEGAQAFSAAARGGGAASATWIALTGVLAASDAAPPLRARSSVSQLSTRALWHGALIGRGALRLRPVHAAPDAIYLNVSHTGLSHPRVLRAFVSPGMRRVVMAHDLIPILYPEYCSPGAKPRHVRRIARMLEFASLIIANSETTVRDLTAYARAMGAPLPALKVAPLGLEADFLGEVEPLTAARPYFVVVGTLEARKNLAFLLALWRRLAERMGDAAPRLVLVGRRGWENESLLDQLERSEAAARLVHEVSDLQDPQLVRLMAGAKALLALSFAEGYDLPVVEAMALGTPVIASDIAVHREVAPGARLIDPLDGPAWLAAIEEAAGSGRRGAPYVAPRWEDHFAAIEAPLFDTR